MEKKRYRTHKKSIFKKSLRALRLLRVPVFVRLCHSLLHMLTLLLSCGYIQSKVAVSSKLFWEIWITFLPHWLIFKMFLGPEDGGTVSETKIFTLRARNWKTQTIRRLEAKPKNVHSYVIIHTMWLWQRVRLTTLYFTFYKPPTNKALFVDRGQIFLRYLRSLGRSFPPRNFTVKLLGFLVFPCLLLVYTVVLDWNRILGFFFFWAGSWSRQTEPADFLSPMIPQAVCRLCKHTFPPPPLLCLPADGQQKAYYYSKPAHTLIQEPCGPVTASLTSSLPCNHAAFKCTSLATRIHFQSRCCRLISRRNGPRVWFLSITEFITRGNKHRPRFLLICHGLIVTEEDYGQVEKQEHSYFCPRNSDFFLKMSI